MKDNLIDNSMFDHSKTGLIIIDNEVEGLCIKDNSIIYARKWIENATILEYITSVGWGAFRGCNLKNIYIFDDRIDFSEVILPKSTTIHCKKNSATYWYAKNNGFNVVTFENIKDDKKENIEKNTEKYTMTGDRKTSNVTKKQTIKVGKVKDYKVSELKKKKISFKLKLKTSGDGKIKCHLYKCLPRKNKKYIKVYKDGVVILKKGAKKGKYKIKIIASGTKKYKVATKVITIKIK